MTRASDETPVPWSARLPRIRRYAEHAFALLLSVGFALGLGPDYGVDNQVIYMLGSLKILDGDLYKRDWVVTSTTHYHRVFEFLAAAFIGLDRGGKGVLFASVLAVVLGTMSLYAIIRALAPRVVLPAFSLLMLIAIATRTKGPAATYVFDHILQPSTLGSVGLLGAAFYFTRGRYFASGLAVAFAGLFHANYLILLFGACFAAHASLGSERLGKRLLLQLGVPFVVLLFVLPVILRTASSPDSARAQEIYANIRAPHHFLITHGIADFAQVVGWNLIGLGGAAILRPTRDLAVRRLLAFTGGLAFMVWGGVIGSVVFHVSAATQLFAWRVAPHVSLLCQLLAAAGLMQVAVRPTDVREVPTASVLLVGSGVGIIGFHYGAKNEPNVAYLTLAFAGAAVLSTVVLYVARLAFSGESPRLPKWVPTTFGTFVYAVGTLVPLVAFWKTVEPTITNLRSRSTIFQGISSNERELCDFMRTKTPKDALFLSPPAVETIRFHSQRAIVADWKSNPVVPSEVIEWDRRMGELSGRAQFNGYGDLSGYESMDTKRLSHLANEFKADYLILGRGRSAQIGCYQRVFENARYDVFDLSQPCANAAPPVPPPPALLERPNDEEN